MGAYEVLHNLVRAAAEFSGNPDIEGSNILKSFNPVKYELRNMIKE
jgi:hypothetical protein